MIPAKAGIHRVGRGLLTGAEHLHRTHYVDNSVVIWLLCAADSVPVGIAVRNS